MTDYNKSEEPIEVPNPAGVYINGEKVETFEPTTIKTSWPGFIDPITGYTLELAVDEQVGMKIESDEDLLAWLDTVDEKDGTVERLIDYVRDATAEYIVERLMNSEER